MALRPMLEFTVVRTEQLSPHLIRVVLGGAGFTNFVDNDCTDRYVKLVVPRPGVTYPEPFTMESVQTALPRELWPAIRTYTVRRYDPAAQELWIDFVHHGDEGIAGPWAARARPGDVIRLRGPGGAYRPDPTADHHLLAGDAAALPAIASALEAVPETASVTAIIEVDERADCIELTMPPSIALRWLCRSEGSQSFAEAVRSLDLPPGRTQAFVHGELHDTLWLKPLLLDRGVHPDDLSLSGYWRRGKDEEGFQAEKHELASQ